MLFKLIDKQRVTAVSNRGLGLGSVGPIGMSSSDLASVFPLCAQTGRNVADANEAFLEQVPQETAQKLSQRYCKIHSEPPTGGLVNRNRSQEAKILG